MDVMEIGRSRWDHSLAGRGGEITTETGEEAGTFTQKYEKKTGIVGKTANITLLDPY